MTSEEEEHRLSFGESRIDMALTQTSINLNAVNRNQEVRNKYETVESHYKVLLEPPHETVEEKPVSIKVEAEKQHKKSHFGTIILAIFIIGIVLAIGFGAYYLLTNYLD